MADEQLAAAYGRALDEAAALRLQVLCVRQALTRHTVHIPGLGDFVSRAALQACLSDETPEAGQ